MYNVTFSKCGIVGVNYHLKFAWSHYCEDVLPFSTVSSKCSTALRTFLAYDHNDNNHNNHNEYFNRIKHPSVFKWGHLKNI